MISMSEIIVRLKEDRIKITGGEYVRDLVRCKDCKWYGETGCAIGIVSTTDRPPKSNDYCSYGEKV